MSIHIPENTDIAGLGRMPRSVGATRARRNQMFTVLDFIPPERRCRNGEIVPAWDKCLEDYQISPPGQARKAEYGMGGLSKSFTPKKIFKIRPVAPLITKPEVTMESPAIEKAKTDCFNAGGTWVPEKRHAFDRSKSSGMLISRAYCQPKVVAPTGSGKQGMFARLQAVMQAVIAAQRTKKVATKLSDCGCEE